MADLKNMTGTEAFQLAKDESALLSKKSLFHRSPSVIKRYLNAGTTISPSLEMIPRLCSTLGNNILCAGWRRKSKRRKTPSPPPKKQDRGIDHSVVRAGAAGNVQRILAETQVIVPHNARKLRSALNDVITECRVAKNRSNLWRHAKIWRMYPYIVYEKRLLLIKKTSFRIGGNRREKTDCQRVTTPLRGLPCYGV